jgi:hypothetical protein
MTTYYQPTHEQQTRSGNTAVTRSSGCTWTSGATGADAATGGKKDRTPDYIHSLLKRSEETNPTTPGWSLGDLRVALGRLGVPFEVRSGLGWPALTATRKQGLYIVLQGDSDQFGNNTCSGVFNGDHAIGIRPTGTTNSWVIDDPICRDARYESPTVLLRYAKKLDPNIRFGVFLQKVPSESNEWVAAISGKEGGGLREFFVYKVADHTARPLRIIDRETRRTGGRTLPCSAPIRAARGPGWTGTPPPAGLVRLKSAFDGGWSYVDAKFAKEV